jgi:hypothetical protein
MIDVYHSASRDAFAKSCRRHFTNVGWYTETTEASDLDFRIIKHDIRYVVACLDSNVLNYLSVSDIIDRMHAVYYQYRLMGMALVYITNFALLGHSAETLSRLGLSVFREDEMGALEQIRPFIEKPGPASDILTQLLALQPGPCFEIGDKLAATDDIVGAVSWYILAGKTPGGYGSSLKRRFHLFRRIGDLAQAAEMGREILAIEQDNREYLVAMRDLSIADSDQNAVDFYQQKLDSKPDAPLTLEAILERQRQVSASLHMPMTGKKSLSFWKKFISRQ